MSSVSFWKGLVFSLQALLSTIPLLDDLSWIFSLWVPGFLTLVRHCEKHLQWLTNVDFCWLYSDSNLVIYGAQTGSFLRLMTFFSIDTHRVLIQRPEPFLIDVFAFVWVLPVLCRRRASVGPSFAFAGWILFTSCLLASQILIFQQQTFKAGVCFPRSLYPRWAFLLQTVPSTKSTSMSSCIVL